MMVNVGQGVRRALTHKSTDGVPCDRRPRARMPALAHGGASTAPRASASQV